MCSNHDCPLVLLNDFSQSIGISWILLIVLPINLIPVYSFNNVVVGDVANIILDAIMLFSLRMGVTDAANTHVPYNIDTLL